MAGTDFCLTVLGSRGSMAISGAEYTQFGGASSCYMVRAGEETVFLDAGTGLFSAPRRFPKPPVILLSHLHLDHLIGLAGFLPLPETERPLRLYVPFCADAQEACGQMDRLFSPPFWPVKLEQMAGGLEILPLPERFRIGEILVECMPGNHPGGCMVYRLSFDGKRLVYATDYEHGTSADAELAAFSRGADLLLYDAQFDAAEYEAKRGYGHSTAEKGLALLEASGARRLLLIHHDPASTDRRLLKREARLPTAYASYAREGQTVSL